MERLKLAVEGSNVDEIRLLAHSVKGVAANLSGISLQRVASDLEAAAKAGETAQFSQLMQDMSFAHQAFSKRLTQHQVENPKNSEDVKV